MFLDIHAHAYRKPVPVSQPVCLAGEELFPLYDRLGIEQAVLLPAGQSGSSCRSRTTISWKWWRSGRTGSSFLQH